MDDSAKKKVSNSNQTSVLTVVPSSMRNQSTPHMWSDVTNLNNLCKMRYLCEKQKIGNISTLPVAFSQCSACKLFWNILIDLAIFIQIGCRTPHESLWNRDLSLQMCRAWSYYCCLQTTIAQCLNISAFWVSATYTRTAVGRLWEMLHYNRASISFHYYQQLSRLRI